MFSQMILDTGGATVRLTTTGGAYAASLVIKTTAGIPQLETTLSAPLNALQLELLAAAALTMAKHLKDQQL